MNDEREARGLAQALYAYEAKEERVLSFIAGERLFCWPEEDSGWWWARKQNGEEGYIPSTFVQVIQNERAEEEALQMAIDLSLQDAPPIARPISTTVVAADCTPLRPPTAPPFDLMPALSAVLVDDLPPSSRSVQSMRLQIPSPPRRSMNTIHPMLENRTTKHKSPLRKVVSFLAGNKRQQKKEIESLREQNALLEYERLRLEQELSERDDAPRSPSGNSPYFTSNQSQTYPDSCPAAIHRQISAPVMPSTPLSEEETMRRKGSGGRSSSEAAVVIHI